MRGLSAKADRVRIRRTSSNRPASESDPPWRATVDVRETRGCHGSALAVEAATSPTFRSSVNGAGGDPFNPIADEVELETEVEVYVDSRIGGDRLCEL